jgi:hypothetical protein
MVSYWKSTLRLKNIMRHSTQPRLLRSNQDCKKGNHLEAGIVNQNNNKMNQAVDCRRSRATYGDA